MKLENPQRVLKWGALTFGILTTLMGVIGMSSFILEETLQAQGFGYAVAAMNKEWKIALAVLEEEEPYLRANARVLIKKWNPVTGRAFRAYAAATLRKLDNDKEFYKYMIQKENQAKYLASLNKSRRKW